MSGTQHTKSQAKTQAKTQSEIEIDDYLSGFTEQERIVKEIAEQHLETSFDITKSIGFIEWKQSKSK
tara:strand:- start:786 stop:986 length:201 start_codon:yes stop_codon:yes gene_type:complete